MSDDSPSEAARVAGILLEGAGSDTPRGRAYYR